MNAVHIVGKPLAIVFTLSLVLGSAPSARSDQLQSLVDSNTAFGLNLYGQLATNTGNLFFSPYSISTCLAMTYAGARDETEQQMAQVLGFGTNQQQFSSSFGELQREVESMRAQKGIQLKVANALWTQKGFPFLSAFLETAMGQYQANVNQANFVTGANAAMAAINRWVAQQTQDKILNILPPGSFNPLTRLVLANAIYFKGAWVKSFEKGETLTQPFHVSSTNEVNALLMQKLDAVNYMETSDFQAVELPYGGKTSSMVMQADEGVSRADAVVPNGGHPASMVILLPSQVDGYGQLEEQLSPAFLSSVLAQMTNQTVQIFLPRFTLSSGFDLVDTLAEMGMPDAFDAAADFSGMDGTADLSISHVFHKAWGEVDEEGTEAAASTVVTVVTSVVVGPSPSIPVFRADHPFIFFIRDAQSGSVLFLGRLVDPSN
jgi:serpin B